MSVTVRPAALSERPLIAGLIQFYTYDFSAFEDAGSDRFDFRPDGQFDPYPLDRFWRDPGCWPLLIEVGGKTAGFALLDQGSHRGAFNDRHMAEFFVARKFRKAGVGSEAVRQILALHPGRWEIAVIARNEAAQAFWPRAIEAAGATDINCEPGDGVQWTGPIWSFRV